MQDIVDGLRRARRDDRVRALVVKVGGGRIGLARMQELREAVGAFRESGKLTVAWSETFGEFTHGNVPYYLATAFDRIYLQPSGSVGLTGVAVEQLFLHDALAKAGIAFQSAKRYEYKSAADNLTERGFTGPRGRPPNAWPNPSPSRSRPRSPSAGQDRGTGPRAARPGAVPGRRRPGRGPDRRARLPGRGLRDVRKEAGPTRSCSTSPATSGRMCWPSEPRSCPTRASASSR
jgi:Periplasmic serine proteases (ClpP class)